MAIDYLVGVSCQPQQVLGAERLVNLHRSRILARTMLAHMREDGDTREAREIEIQLTVRMPEGDSGRGVTLQDLMSESAPLDEVSDHCTRCPVNFKHAFSCHRRIRYPIPERVEQWLMARLPTNLQCTAGAMLVRSLGELGWDGAPAKKLRDSGTTYFESRAPYGVRWEGTDGTAVEVSSDQLLHMMFLVGTLNPAHCLMLALFMGVIPHDTSLHDLKDDAGRQRVLASAHVDTEADADIEQLAAFLRALAVAARHDVPILVDG